MQTLRSRVSRRMESKMKYSFLEFDEQNYLGDEASSMYEAGFHNGRKSQFERTLPIMKQLLEIIEMQNKALRQYADGNAYGFDRKIRGEVNFNAALSSEIARSTLASVEEKLRGLG